MACRATLVAATPRAPQSEPPRSTLSAVVARLPHVLRAWLLDDTALELCCVVCVCHDMLDTSSLLLDRRPRTILLLPVAELLARHHLGVVLVACLLLDVALLALVVLVAGLQARSRHRGCPLPRRLPS